MVDVGRKFHQGLHQVRYLHKYKHTYPSTLCHIHERQEASEAQHHAEQAASGDKDVGDYGESLEGAVMEGA